MEKENVVDDCSVERVTILTASNLSLTARQIAEKVAVKDKC